jgi:DNA-binding NtrC family response regulator
MYRAGVKTAKAASRSRPCRVLVVNTDSYSQRTIREALKSTVNEIVFTEPQQEWRRILEHPAPFSVVLIDATDKEGAFSLLEDIRRNWPEASVVFFSNDMQFWMESIQRGAYDMLPKPLSASDLTWIVSGAVSRHRAA